VTFDSKTTYHPKAGLRVTRVAIVMMTHKGENMEGRVGYLDLVRNNANYRNLWFGQIVSLLGDWFNLIASAALIASLTQSGLAVGGLFVIRMLAPFLVSPIAGVIADRYNRKNLLIITDLLNHKNRQKQI